MCMIVPRPVGFHPFFFFFARPVHMQSLRMSQLKSCWIHWAGLDGPVALGAIYSVQYVRSVPCLSASFLTLYPPPSRKTDLYIQHRPPVGDVFQVGMP